MSPTLLLPSLLAALYGGSGIASWAEIGLSLTGAARVANPGPGYPGDPEWLGVAAEGTLSATLYLGHPVRDDATPIGLQSFLQRRSTLHVRATAVEQAWPVRNLGSDAEDPQGAAPAFVRRLADNDLPPNTDPNLVVATIYPAAVLSLALDLYLTQWLAITAGADYSQDTFVSVFPTCAEAYRCPREGPMSQITASFGLGFRLGDFRLDAGARVYNSPESPTVIGAPLIQLESHVVADGALAIRAVLLEHIDLGARFLFTQDRVLGAIDIDYYPSRRLGLFFGTSFAHAPFYVAGQTSPSTYFPMADSQAISLRVGVALWLSHRTSLRLDYAPTWSSYSTNIASSLPNVGELDQRLTFTANFRIP